MNDLVFLDTETTGLEPERHEVWEIAYAIGDGKIVSFQVPHSLQTADPEALALNGYWSRAERSKYLNNESADPTMRKILTGCTLVVANPTFDRMFLRARWGVEPWHYRSIDVESVALGILQYERPQGMKTITDDLGKLGYPISTPDHSAANDVLALREAYYALRDIQKKGIRVN